MPAGGACAPAACAAGLGILAATAARRTVATRWTRRTGRPSPRHRRAAAGARPRRDPRAVAESTTGRPEPSELPPEAYAGGAVKCETASSASACCAGWSGRRGAGRRVELRCCRCSALQPRLHSEPELHPTHSATRVPHAPLVRRHPVAIRAVEHAELLRTQRQRALPHYDFFWHRSHALAHGLRRQVRVAALFLVEAIGVPVLLSLLLLTYSNSPAATSSTSTTSAGPAAALQARHHERHPEAPRSTPLRKGGPARRGGAEEEEGRRRRQQAREAQGRARAHQAAAAGDVGVASEQAKAKTRRTSRCSTSTRSAARRCAWYGEDDVARRTARRARARQGQGRRPAHGITRSCPSRTRCTRPCPRSSST